jgi:cation diffusion facilitator CzcD-associated flavoprotein CzcO
MDDEVYDVAILGAGLAGLGMGMKLKMAGEDNFVILEKEDRVGGTWRDNSYPGASCDVQSHLYWFSFDDQPDWSRVFAMQPEIQANIERLVARRGLNQHIRLGAEVTEAVWSADAGQWVITTATGEQLRARAFTTAWGQLNRPSFKGIEGREHFDGVSFHSARWRHDVDLTGKRVASIGNGASAVQFIPEVAEVAEHLTVFQRTPNYVVPRQDRPYTEEERRMFLDDPDRLRESRDGFYWEHEGWIGAMKLETNPVAEEFTRVAREHLETQVPDPALREKLWPDYPIGCKRLLIADTFYPALMRENVDLVTEHIDRIEPAGVRTADGHLHEVDVIIYATGFETLSFIGHVDIVGRAPRSWPPRAGDGVSLRDAWREAPEAYLGMTVSGFPNLFILYGPNTNLGHNSILAMLECQFDYVLQALSASRERGAALDLQPEVLERYNSTLQEELRSTSFAGSCNSWYKTPDGRITNNWSGSVEDYRARTARFDLADYELVPVPVHS